MGIYNSLDIAIPYRYLTVFDIETTGLSANQDNILQLCYMTLAVNLDNLRTKVVSVKSEYLKYDEPIKMSWEARKINKISPETIRELGKPYRDVLLDFYRDAARTILIGYNNARFDNRFISAALTRHCHMDPSVQDYDATIDVFNIVKSTVRASSKSGKASLADAIEVYGVTDEDVIRFMNNVGMNVDDKIVPHDARYDTVATYLVALKGGVMEYAKKTLSEENNR